jgi:SPP1 gp7 family putative phage head morphogenesis protein
LNSALNRRGSLGKSESDETLKARIPSPAPSMARTAAVETLSRRVAMTPRDYSALDPADKPAAFTIPDVDSLDVIERIQRELLVSLRDGATFRSFYRQSLAHFAQASIRAPSRRRLERLFQTELAASYAAARAARLLEPGIRISLPYWEYHCVGNSRDCRSHEALNGFIARWNDLVWLTIYPPNGPRCRCEVAPLTIGAARRLAGERIRIPADDRLPSGLRVRYPQTVLPFILGVRPFLRR